MTTKKQDNFLELSETVTLTNSNMFYTWLKYADDNKGTGMSDNPDGKEWFGIAYNKKTLEESDDYRDYKWSKIKGDKGDIGEQGLPGDTGPDGKTTYFHIKYSFVEKPQHSHEMQEEPATFIGTYVDFIEEDSEDPNKYQWHRLEGIQGPKGENGIAGGIGPDGKPAYLHIKYSDDGKKFTYPNGETPGNWLGQYVDDILKDSNDFNRYKWSKIKGEDGRSFTVKGQLASTEELFRIKGKEGEAYIVLGNLWGWIVGPNGEGAWVDLGKIKGEDGKNGITLYTWIKYADDDKGTGMSNNALGKKYIGFAYNKTTDIEIDDYRLYTWSKIQANEFTIEGTLDSEKDLPPTGSVGTGYIINGELWMWKIDPKTGIGSWANMGQFIGGSNVYAEREPSVIQWDFAQSLIEKRKVWSGVKNWKKVNKGDILIVSAKISDKKYAICHIYCDVVEQPTNENITTFVRSTLMGPEGPQGQKGLDGLQGPKGENGIAGPAGTSSYFHIKYSSKSKPTLPSDMTETPSEYIGTYVDNKPIDSDKPSDYKWYRFQGLQGPKGTNGIPGGIGPDGKPAYLHIKYSDDGGKSFTENGGETPGKYIGQYVDDQKADSSNPGDYTWSLIKGSGVIMADTISRTRVWRDVENIIGKEHVWDSIKNWATMDKNDTIIIPIKISDKKYATCHVYCEVLHVPVDTNVSTKVLSAQMGPEGPQGDRGPEGPRLDWIDDWEGGKVTIGGAKIITPKIFAGRLDSVVEGGSTVKKPTGVAVGEKCFGTLSGFSNMAGICAYNKGKQTFSITTEGQVFFGDPTGQNGLISYKDGNLSISANTITFKGSNLANSLGTGGSNLIKNGTARDVKNGKVQKWIKNDGSSTPPSVDSGSPYGSNSSFKTTGVGIIGTDWITLKPNTDYIYQGMVQSTHAVSDTLTSPLSFFCSTGKTTDRSGVDIVEFKQNLQPNKWGTAYIHFRTIGSVVYFKPMVNARWNNEATVKATDLYLHEGTTTSPYSPHPDEVYTSTIQVSDSGLIVKNGNFEIQDSTGRKALFADTVGNLRLAGTLVGGTIKNLNGTVTIDLNNARDNQGKTKGITIFGGGVNFYDKYNDASFVIDQSGGSYCQKSLQVAVCPHDKPKVQGTVLEAGTVSIYPWGIRQYTENGKPLVFEIGNAEMTEFRKISPADRTSIGETQFSSIKCKSTIANSFVTFDTREGAYPTATLIRNEINTNGGDGKAELWLNRTVSVKGAETTVAVGNGLGGKGYLTSGKMYITDKLTVAGQKNCIQNTENYGCRAINAYETAEYYFGDIGEGVIDENGYCYITIEDIFLEVVNTRHSYQVFLQKYGEGELYVSERKDSYFVVKGKPNTSFAWEIKAKRKGYETDRMELIDAKKEVIE